MTIFEELPSLSPVQFFALSWDCPHIKSDLRASVEYRLPSTAELLGEEEFAEKVAALMSSTTHLPKIQSLGVLGAIFEKVALHIGNDNGPKHIAVACGAPTFAIFGLQDPNSWTFPDPSRHRWVSPLEFCEMCRSGAHSPTADCLAKIPVEEVYKRVSDMTGTLPGFKKSIPERA